MQIYFYYWIKYEQIEFQAVDEHICVKQSMAGSILYFTKIITMEIQWLLSYRGQSYQINQRDAMSYSYLQSSYNNDIFWLFPIWSEKKYIRFSVTNRKSIIFFEFWKAIRIRGTIKMDFIINLFLYKSIRFECESLVDPESMK